MDEETYCLDFRRTFSSGGCCGDFLGFDLVGSVMSIHSGINKCQWEEDECDIPAHGGEFYCLTHLQESESAVWKFANTGDGETRKMTLEELEAYLDERKALLMSASRFLGMTFPPPQKENNR